MNSTKLQPLTALLWPRVEDAAAHRVYWLLDGARDPEISRRVRHGALRFWCLYSGSLTPALRAAAPYLVQLDPGAAATLALLERGWGQAWGIFIVAPGTVDMSRVRLHLKKFLRVRTEGGQRLLFRFYDPRVLPVFLPTCTDEEFTRFLGPLQRLFVEADEGAGWQAFESEGGRLRSRSGRIEN